MITRVDIFAWLLLLLMQHPPIASIAMLVQVRAFQPRYGHRHLRRATPRGANSRKNGLASLPDPSESPPAAPSSTTSPSEPPFRLGRIDHVVLRCRDYPVMFDFYHRILGCTVDGPRDAHVNRFGGALTHLRAGSCYIDLLAYDTEHLTMEGREAVARIHAGGVGLDGGRGIADVNLSHETSTLDHLCLRIDPFDRRRLLDYFDGEDVDIVKRESAGDARVGADGVGPSLYLRDPEGNVIELKGSLIRDDNAKNIQFEKASRMPNDSVQNSWDNYDTTADGDSQCKNSHENSPSPKASDKNSNASGVPVSPCIRICRYNSAFYDGQVCIGCFREAYEIGTWQSMTPQQKSMTLLDSIDRCSGDTKGDRGIDEIFDGAITMEELKQQFMRWSDLADGK
jgi:predicted Fe-S protein YdhL (DUF1289 family)/catechol 2,3-dioxygenase-like lactoylglutathione lyase family enzyme